MNSDDLDRQSNEILERILDRPARRYRAGFEEAVASFPELSYDDALATLRKDARSRSETDVKGILLSIFLSSYRERLKWTAEVGDFMPEDISDLLMDYAEEAGVDLHRLGSALAPTSSHPEYEVGLALRTVLESAGIYTEVPGALTYSQVSRKVLLIIGAALIGIATAKTARSDPALAGTVGGVGGLILNIMAARYDQRPLDPGTDWLEELVLRILEELGIQSFGELQARTNIHVPLLKKVLSELRRKGLVEQHRSWIDKTDLRYDLTGRH